MAFYKRQSKYRSVITERDGIKFRSRLEADRWTELNLMWQGRAIQGLRRQVRFDLTVRGYDGKEVVIETYVADFVYLDGPRQIVEDAKGFLTADFKRKRKWMKLVYGIEILETGLTWRKALA